MDRRNHHHHHPHQFTGWIIMRQKSAKQPGSICLTWVIITVANDFKTPSMNIKP